MTAFILSLWIIGSCLRAQSSVFKEPRTLTPRKKAPKSIQVEVLNPGTNCSIRATKGDRAEVFLDSPFIPYSIIILHSQCASDSIQAPIIYNGKISWLSRTKWSICIPDWIWWVNWWFVESNLFISYPSIYLLGLDQVSPFIYNFVFFLFTLGNYRNVY